MPTCNRDTCFWPDVACNLGHRDPSDCPFLQGDPAPGPNDTLPPDSIMMPWSGDVLGLADLAFVAARKKPTVLAIVGPQNAGKTTLLAAWYLLLGQGASPDRDQRFCGSCSLSGWEVVAQPLRWKPGPVLPSFPPHTTSQGTRVPGLLHLSFRRGLEDPTNYLLTDAPGEWFRDWAHNRDASSAEGARWAAEHADAFILVADREALAGKHKAAARTDMQILARRLGTEANDRPVALVWTKADKSVDSGTEANVRKAVCRAIPSVAEFTVSVKPLPDGDTTSDAFMALLQWFLNVRRPSVRLPPPECRNANSLFILDAG